MKKGDILEDPKTKELYEVKTEASEYNNWRTTVRELKTGLYYATSLAGYVYLLEKTLVPFVGAKVLSLRK